MPLELWGYSLIRFDWQWCHPGNIITQTYQLSSDSYTFTVKFWLVHLIWHLPTQPQREGKQAWFQMSKSLPTGFILFSPFAYFLLCVASLLLLQPMHLRQLVISELFEGPLLGPQRGQLLLLHHLHQRLLYSLTDQDLQHRLHLHVKVKQLQRILVVSGVALGIFFKNKVQFQISVGSF